MRRDGTTASQIDAALRVASGHLADRLLGAYLFGSAMEGGLRVFSDLDLMLVVDGPLRASVRRSLVAGWLPLSGSPGSARRPLEITVVALPDIRPWRYPAARELQFGEWLRQAFEAGDIPPPQSDPDLAILLSQVRQNSRALHGPPADALIDAVPGADVNRAIADCLADVLEGWREDPRNALLALSRMWLTLTTGEIRSKDAAAGWAMQRLPEPDRAVVARARAEYLGDERHDWHRLDGQVELAVAVLEKRIRSGMAHR